MPGESFRWGHEFDMVGVRAVPGLGPQRHLTYTISAMSLTSATDAATRIAPASIITTIVPMRLVSACRKRPTRRAMPPMASETTMNGIETKKVGTTSTKGNAASTVRRGFCHHQTLQRAVIHRVSAAPPRGIRVNIAHASGNGASLVKSTPFGLMICDAPIRQPARPDGAGRAHGIKYYQLNS